MSISPSRRLPRALAVLAFLVAAHATAQAQSTAPATITISGDVPTPLTLTAAELSAMPRATAMTTTNGVATTYAGVALVEVLKRSGLALGAGAHGAHGSLAGYVLAKASDGYQVVFSIGEIDPAITDQQILLADSVDGKPLFAQNGSFRLVIPKDKRGARSLRMLTALEVVVLKK